MIVLGDPVNIKRRVTGNLLVTPATTSGYLGVPRGAYHLSTRNGSN